MAKSPIEMQREEHDPILHARRTSLVSAATVYAVVNTAAAGQASVVLDTGENWVGLATVWNANSASQVTVFQGGSPWNSLGTTTLGAAIPVGSNAIGKLAANSGVDIGDVTLTAGSAFIGLATVNIGSSPTLIVNATGQGDIPITLDSEAVVLGAGAAWVGLATIEIGANKDVTLKSGVSIYQGTLPWSSLGTASLGAAIPAGANYIGLATVIQGNQPALVAGAAYIGCASVNVGNAVALGAGVAGIGFTTVSNPNLEYSYAYTSGPTIDWAVKGSAGFIHAILIGAAVASSIVEISDHASDGNGAVKFYLAGNTIGPALYPLNAKMATGICLDITAQTHVTVMYR